MSETSKLIEQLQDKAYREAFVFSQMSIPISFQVRALREHQGLTQKQLAEKAGMLQPRIVELERPKGKEPNLRTLGRLAAAFDVALIVRFVPFSELVEWAEKFSPDTFIVHSFDNDPGLHEREAASNNMTNPLLIGSVQKQDTSRTIDGNLNYDRIPFQPPIITDIRSGREITYGGEIKYDGEAA